ncbi:MAG: TIM barrel protein [Spirochaetales bacterium]|nr:TIM barrel protein [Spirochaetales bacterium]
MLKKSQIAFNRIIYPKVGIDEFFALTAELGLHKVELRNDLPGGEIIDGMSPVEIRELAGKHGIEILTINALQKFNLPGRRGAAVRELKSLIRLALSIGCPAVVLCPNNDRGDSRTGEQSLRDTVESLREFRPLFEDSGMLGYVEPLGFAESSLDSVFAAAGAIGEAGGECYRIVYDTFHHYLGPDDGAQLEQRFDVSLLGIVHASGVEEDLPRDAMRDEHRVLITGEDRMGTLRQIERLISMGYGGNVALEPFSGRVQELAKDDFSRAAARCIEMLTR